MRWIAIKLIFHMRDIIVAFIFKQSLLVSSLSPQIRFSLSSLNASRYLQEVGYTDTILDVRSQRVRSLLGLSNSEPNGSVETKNLEQILNGGESPSSKQKGQEIKR